jgi:hypothetical protein
MRASPAASSSSTTGSIPRHCLSLDYTPDTLERSSTASSRGAGATTTTARVTVDGKVVREVGGA